MAHLYLSGQPVRIETWEPVIDALIVAGWVVIPDPEDPSATWDGDDWVAPTPLPSQADYRRFWDAVLISDVYAALYAYANSSLPTNTALTAFIAAFQDAKEGRANPPAIQSYIFLVMGAASSALTVEHLAELQALIDAHGLSGAYTLTPPE